MKNSKLRLIAVITVIALMLTACGIYTFANTAPAPVVVNNGEGTGNNTMGWVGENPVLWTKSYVNNDVTGGKAINITATTDRTQAQNINFKTDTISNPAEMTAFSMYVEFPDLGDGKSILWSSFRPAGEEFGFYGDVYAIGNDGTLVSKNQNRFYGGFKGTLLYVRPADDAVAFKGWSNNSYTWEEFFTEKQTSISVISTYFANDVSMLGKTIVIDEVTAYYDDTNALLDRFNLLITPPTSSISGGLVAKGTTVKLTANEGYDIYYTLDGTEPDKTSTKYSAEAPIVINEECTLKAAAYNGDSRSLTTICKYTFLDPNLPNVTVLNTFDDAATFTSGKSHDGVTSVKTVVEGVSPYGNAVNYLGLGGSGQSMVTMQFTTQIESSIAAAQQAFAFWVNAPAGFDLSLNPCINGEMYGFRGDCITFNTSTHVMERFEYGKYPKLSNFEGFVIFLTEGDDTVRTSWGEADRTNWRDFILEKGFKQVQFYQSHATYYNKTYTVDQLIAITDVDKFIEELKASPKRPLPPYAEPGADAVPMETQIFLYSDAGDDIYYTLDGTLPTKETGTLYTEYSMGNGQGNASYIQIKEETTIKAMAIDLEGNQSGVVTFEYTVEDPYAGPNTVIVNNGTGENGHTTGWFSDAWFTREFVENDSPDGKGIALTLKKPDSMAVAVTFKAVTDGMEQIHNAQGFSFHIDVPYLGKDSYKWMLGPRVNGETNYIYSKIYAVSDDGETILQGDDNISFNQAFKGTVYCVFKSGNAVGQSYGSIKTTWKKFIKNNILTGFGFYFTRNKMGEKEDYEHTVVFDEFTLVYDTAKLFEDIGLEGLLATYDAGTFENTNMIVTNDGSGMKLNAGLTGLTDGLIVEKTDYSVDERSLKLTMPAGESFIQFASTSEADELVIGDGTVFWVEMPKGAGDTELDLALTDNGSGGTELYEYGDKWYYLIDKDGVISRKNGAMIVPDGFRGWIVVPKTNMHVQEKDGYVIDNAELDFNQILDVKVTFKNANGELTGKTVHIDDISFYTDFAELVKARALKWDAPMFE